MAEDTESKRIEVSLTEQQIRWIVLCLRKASIVGAIEDVAPTIIGITELTGMLEKLVGPTTPAPTRGKER